jgi:hypothetical protein
LPLRIDQYRCYRAVVGRTRRQRTDRLNFTRESYTREGLIQNRYKAPGGYYYKTRPGHATQSQRWQQLQDKNDTPKQQQQQQQQSSRLVTATVGGPDHCCKSSSARKFYSSSMSDCSSKSWWSRRFTRSSEGAGMRGRSSVLLYKEGSAVYGKSIKHVCFF